ncbi:phosphatidate cytidylyltransferase [Bacteriovoracaceae bacterium]|nr:phosphatidate cytidylyltransferase [Bacteriovoracaceae bacterium]
MNNTQLRIISATVLLCIFLAFMNFGPLYMMSFILVIFIGLMDEVLFNFTKVSRSNFRYFFFQILTILIAITFFAVDLSPTIIKYIHFSGLFVNFLFLIVLFLNVEKSTKFFSLLKNRSIIWPTMTIVWMLNFLSLFELTQWKILVWGIILLNFSSDSCAWFFGKNFGKRPLWKAVSPNKTIEGAIGGLLCSVFISWVYWWNFLDQISILFIFLLALMAVGAQLGDLIQSRVKRIFDIKDSSNLIPGHGGIYDRFDSLLFVMPIYLVIIRYYLKLN